MKAVVLAAAMLAVCPGAALLADTSDNSGSRIIGILSGDRLIVESEREPYVCGLASGRTGYALEGCQRIALDIPLTIPPEAVGKVDKAALVAILEANGCRMTEERAEAVLPAYGFDDDSVGVWIVELAEAGQLELVDREAILKTENCI